MSELIEQLTRQHRLITQMIENKEFMALANELSLHASYTKDVQWLKIVLVASKPCKDHQLIAKPWKRVQEAFDKASALCEAALAKN